MRLNSATFIPAKQMVSDQSRQAWVIIGIRDLLLRELQNEKKPVEEHRIYPENIWVIITMISQAFSCYLPRGCLFCMAVCGKEPG